MSKSRVTSRLFLVGEAPGGVGGDQRPPLDPSGESGRRVMLMMGLDREKYLARTERRNLFQTPDEGHHWNPEKAALAADMMRFKKGDRVILLGLRVAHAFKLDAWPLFTWFQENNGHWLARVPHPSGRNRKLNDLELRAEMELFLRESVKL